MQSGLRDYRGPEGTYTLHKTYRPIFYHEFVASHKARQRYWCRSYLGIHPVFQAHPNPTHLALALLQKEAIAPHIITQNVDSLHTKASAALTGRPYKSLNPSAASILELHGTLGTVVCLNCHTELDRTVFQQRVDELNPDWLDFAQQLREQNIDPRMNPDGDVHLPEGTSYESFRHPSCPTCDGVLKPSVIFFGENIPRTTRSVADQWVDDASSMLVIGSSLATYSAYRLLKKTKELSRPTAILNLGASRGDPLADVKLEVECNHVMPIVIKSLLGASGLDELQRLSQAFTSSMQPPSNNTMLAS